MLKRLRVKFVAITMAIVAVMLMVIFCTVLYLTRSNLESQSLQMMQSIAANPMQMGRPGEPGREVRLPYFTLQIGQGGEIIATGGGYYDLSDREFLAELISAALTSEKQSGVISRYDLRYCRVATPMGACLVFADMSSERSTIQGLVRNCLLIGAASLLAFFFVSLFLARWAVRPVEEAWNRQRQFVADASHELKTPLTVITTNAELLQSSQSREAQQERAAAGILTMSRQMRGLVESLLELARIDNGATQMNGSAVDLSRLVSDGALPFDAVFFERGLELTCRVEENIRLKGSESHLKQVADILLDNAQKYAAPQSEVVLELKRIGRGQCLLSVASHGEAISPEDLKNIFKRFYRVDKARAMNHSYGLGLSIAESIVRDHRGRIWAESTNGVNTFFVQLPCE